MMNTNEASARELKRRTLRWQKHKRPRKPDRYLAFQRVAAVAVMLALIGAIAFTCGMVFARIGIHYEVGEYPQTEYQWATVNGWKVNFRGGPGKDYPILEQSSMGAGVEVIKVQDGWAKCWCWQSTEPVWICGEYLVLEQ